MSSFGVLAHSLLEQYRHDGSLTAQAEEATVNAGEDSLEKEGPHSIACSFLNRHQNIC